MCEKYSKYFSQLKVSHASHPFSLPLITAPDTAIVQSDGAWNEATQTAGLGALIASQQGRWTQASAAPFVASPLIAEGLALKAAIIKCKQLGLQKLRCEADSSQLVKAINGGNTIAELYGIVADIIHLSASFISISFTWIPRENNKTADSLAKHALFEYSAVLNPPEI